jgi:hypothetical protein
VPDGHLVVWSLRQLADEVKTIGTLLALDYIWPHHGHPYQHGDREAGALETARRDGQAG